MRSCVNASCSSAEHGLEERIGLFWLVTRYHFGWFHVNFFANHELRKLDQLYKEIDLGVFFSYTFRIELFTSEEPSTELSCGHCSGENIVQISEWRLCKQLLSHLRLLEDLLVHLSSWLPKIVTHISIYSNF